MIRRLVEQEEIGLLRQGRSEAEAPPLAAGEACQRSAHGLRRKAEVRCDDSHTPLEFVTSGQVVRIDQSREICEGGVRTAGGVVFRDAELVAQLHHLRERAEKGIEHRALGTKFMGLARIRDPTVLSNHDRPGVGHEFTSDETQ